MDRYDCLFTFHKVQALEMPDLYERGERHIGLRGYNATHRHPIMIIALIVCTHTFVGCGFEYRCGWHALMCEKWARFLYIISAVAVMVVAAAAYYNSGIM